MHPHIQYEFEGESVCVELDRAEMTIGRAKENDIVVPDKRVSRRHAKFSCLDDRWTITDLGSSNGTRVNGNRVESVEIAHGDRIQLHKFVFDFFVRPATVTAGLRDDTDVSHSETVFSNAVVRSAVDFTTLASMEPGAGSDSNAEGRAERLSKILNIVTRASRALLSSGSLDETLDTVLELVFQNLRAERGCILLWNEESQALQVRCVRQEGDVDQDIQFSQTIAEKVFRERISVLTSDALADERFAAGDSVVNLNIRSAMAAPLWDGNKVEGLIYVDNLARVRAFDSFDLDLLSALGNHAAVAIAKSRMQASIVKQQLVRERLGRYHSPDVIEHITANRGADGALVADEREVTVMFADVVGFTSRCETMPAKEVAETLNRYFSELAEVVFRYRGTLDKYIGDCMMAVFGAPLAAEDHALRCAAAALDMRAAMRDLADPLAPGQELQFRIGIHSGRVIAGDIGSERRSDYTVLGATVNLAARIESNVAEVGQLVVSAATNELIQEAFETRHLGEFQPKGIANPIACYELVSGRTPSAEE